MEPQGHNKATMTMYEAGPGTELQGLWARQYEEAERTWEFKNHSLPLARIKKIMKADEDVRMISAEAPVVFARACEMFVLELTLRSWAHTEENKRRTLQKNDIAAAITRTDIFDFLVDIVPREDLANNDPPDSLPYCYMPPPPQHPMMDSSSSAAIYMPPPPPYMAHHPPMWPPGDRC